MNPEIPPCCRHSGLFDPEFYTDRRLFTLRVVSYATMAPGAHPNSLKTMSSFPVIHVSRLSFFFPSNLLISSLFYFFFQYFSPYISSSFCLHPITLHKRLACFSFRNENPLTLVGSIVTSNNKVMLSLVPTK